MLILPPMAVMTENDCRVQKTLLRGRSTIIEGMEGEHELGKETRTSSASERQPGALRSYCFGSLKILLLRALVLP
jgi:hypothetical protein